ncbi:DUF4832 domain-containing protein [Bacillus sp. FJAT-49732]|uniref:DUF4832 domain-containing protein n=1 Tax=Lederbergia citrisecunda TaxID=2833583 RepID=A0A942YK37_9BACI|nr:DUF4832 domain-containing protein [Lederbergia citrisecunda]MBS4198200.1 DUF4832 domain-containing protein [Lederbergia citrisecunda]
MRNYLNRKVRGVLLLMLALSLTFSGGWSNIQQEGSDHFFEGKPDQWDTVPHAQTSATQQLEIMKAVQQDGKLYAMVKGPGLESGGTWYIDIDGNDKSGLAIPYWTNSKGIDVKVEEGTIWAVKDGRWETIGESREVYNSSVRELELDLSKVENYKNVNLRIAFAQLGSQYLPSPGRQMLVVPPQTDNAFGPDVNITVDAEMDDWEGIEPVAISADGKTMLYAAMDHENLFLIAKGRMAEFNDIFIDTDRSSDTGYTGAGWLEFGGDWLVENGGLYKSTGAGWNWGPIDGVDIKYAEKAEGEVKTIEYSIPLEALEIPRPRPISLGLTSNDIRVPDSSQKAPTINPPLPKMNVDGDAEKWESFPLTANGEGDVISMKAFARNKKVSILALASNFNKETNIFIDSDNNFETGYQGWEFKRTGADYLIQNGRLYESTGSGWAWKEIGPVPWIVADSNTKGVKILETEADLSSFSNANDTMRVAIGVGGDYAPAVSSEGEYALATGPSGGKIILDGYDSDWVNIDTAIKGKGDNITVRATQDNEKVYLLVEGDNINNQNTFFLDIDDKSKTGDPATAWKSFGPDAMIKYNQLYLYDNSMKKWILKGPVGTEITSEYALYYFYQDQIGRKKAAPFNISYIGKEAYHLPASGERALHVTEKIQVKEKQNTYEPVERFDVLNNPYMGWVGWAISNKPSGQPHSLVYANITWRDLEPEKGTFNWEAIEKRFQFNKWEKEGVKINLRFVLDDPGNDPDMDIPNWLYQELIMVEGKDGAGKWYNTPSSVVGSGFAPNYNSTMLIAEHERVIKALANRYNNDPRIAFVQIGSLGHWGEFHNWPEEVSGKFPNISVSDQYVRHYIDSFTNKMIGMRKPYPIAAENNLGLFNDVFGSKGATETWIDWTINGWNEIGPYVDNGQTPAEAQAASRMPDFWKKAFSGGEFHSGNALLSLSNDTIMETLKQARESHSSWMGPASPVLYITGKDVTESEQANINLLHNTMGYRYVLESIDFSKKSKVGDKLNLSMTWNNKGVAPFYFKWPLAFALADNKGNLIEESIQTIDSTDIREWLPGRFQEDVNFPITNKLKPGRYTLLVAILDDETKLPGIKLAIEGERKDGWTELEALTVSK